MLSELDGTFFGMARTPNTPLKVPEPKPEPKKIEPTHTEEVQKAQTSAGPYLLFHRNAGEAFISEMMGLNFPGESYSVDTVEHRFNRVLSEVTS